MADPSFTTRAELEEWAKARASKAKSPKAQLAALAEIKRVTLAFVRSGQNREAPQ